MYKLILVLAILLTSGCSTIANLANRAAGVNDEALASSEFVICKGASVGSIERRYNTTELLEARKTLCDNVIVLIKP
jgi:uncharacterized protein YceK